MADHATADLKYGHFGQPIYNPDDQTWLFSRTLESSSTLHPLAASDLIFQSQHPPPPSLSSTTEKPSVHSNRQLAQLVSFHPTLAPSAHLLAAPAVVSLHVEKTVARYDPITGHLLAFGRVPDQATKRSMPIVAFPAADHAHTLRFIQIQPQRHGWHHNKSVWIDVPKIHGESGVWQAPHPICQICFADSDQDSALAHTLAVRTTLAVHILRLSARKNASSWNPLTNAPSRFHVDHLCTLSLDISGHVAPAHVAFNRWYPKQFITVDQQGTWHVWDSSLRQLPSEHGKPIELCRGATNDQAVSDHEAEVSLLDDGWGRATWAGNVQTIITASRRCLGIYDVQGKPVRLQSPNLGIIGTPHWILDILLNPLDPSLVFVLTSVSLFCLRVRVLDEFDPESYSTAGAEIVLQCRHFRDPEDIGLGLSTHVFDQDTVVFIKSSLSSLATSYRFTVDNASSQFLMVADATQVLLPELFSTATTPSAVLSFELHAADYGKSPHHEEPSGPGKLLQDLSVQFYNMTAITRDLTLVQKLYYTLSTSADDSSLPAIAPPDWRAKLASSRSRLQENDFIEASEMQQETMRIEVEQGSAPSTQSGLLKSVRDNWTMVYELAHTQATSTVLQTEDFSQTIGRLKQALSASETIPGEHKLLSELCNKQVLVPDIDQATADFKNLLDMETQLGENMERTESKLVLASIASSMATNFGLKNNTDPTAMYDEIIAHWLAPLSRSVPGRVRLVKEKLARRTAVQVCLASHVLRQPFIHSSTDETQANETRSSEDIASSQLEFPQSSLPTPSPTATPSLTTVTSLSSHPSTLVSPEFARLQRYTTFAPEKSTPAPLPKALANTLAHWNLGGDPDRYDWLAVQREQERRAEEEDEDLTPRERARLKRRAEKLLLKQRRESQKASVMDLASSQVPGIVSASQPTFATPSRSEAPNFPQAARGPSQGTPLLASSQVQPNMFTSQVQPGRYGGKPKKKRRIGF